MRDLASALQSRVKNRSKQIFFLRSSLTLSFVNLMSKMIFFLRWSENMKKFLDEV